MSAYVIAVHGVKSALASLGEVALSGVARGLEEAGRERNLALIADDTPAFMAELRALIEDFKREESGGAEPSQADEVFLREKLDAIKTACEKFNIKAAKAALAELKVRTWPREAGDLIDEISVSLLRGEFKHVAFIAGRGEI